MEKNGRVKSYGVCTHTAPQNSTNEIHRPQTKTQPKNLNALGRQEEEARDAQKHGGAAKEGVVPQILGDVAPCIFMFFFVVLRGGFVVWV